MGERFEADFSRKQRTCARNPLPAFSSTLESNRFSHGHTTVKASRSSASSKPFPSWSGGHFPLSEHQSLISRLDLCVGKESTAACTIIIPRGKIPTIEEAHHAIAAWIQEYAARPQRGHLNGRKPLDVFMEGRGPGFSAEQEVSLRILMSPHEVRQIKRDGITLPGSDIKYYHPALYGRNLQSAQVRFDWQDKSRIFVYTLDGDFICIAEPRAKAHPAAAHLGTEVEKQELQNQIALRRNLEKQTLGPARALFKSTICPEVQFQQDQLGLKGQPPLSSDPRKQLSPPAEISTESEQLTLAEQADVDAVLQELEEAHAKRDLPAWERAHSLSDFDRYEALQEIEASGISLPPSEKAWMSWFERTPIYKRHKAHFEQHQMKVAYMHGA